MPNLPFSFLVDLSRPNRPDFYTVKQYIGRQDSGYRNDCDC